MAAAEIEARMKERSYVSHLLQQHDETKRACCIQEIHGISWDGFFSLLQPQESNVAEVIQQLGEKKKAEEKEKERKEQNQVNQDDEPEIIDVKRPTDVLAKETSAEQNKSAASHSEALRIFGT